MMETGAPACCLALLLNRPWMRSGVVTREVAGLVSGDALLVTYAKVNAVPTKRNH